MRISIGPNTQSNHQQQPQNVPQQQQQQQQQQPPPQPVDQSLDNSSSKLLSGQITRWWSMRRGSSHQYDVDTSSTDSASLSSPMKVPHQMPQLCEVGQLFFFFFFLEDILINLGFGDDTFI